MSSLAASLKKQLALVQEENERHAISLDTVVGALNDALSALEKHDPDFVSSMRVRLGVAQMAPAPPVVDTSAMTSIGSQA